jgi:hypothetical protein
MLNVMEGKESFTSHEDLCGSTLLNLVCQGHILISNVLEASSQIPTCFWDASFPAAEKKRSKKKEKGFDSSSSSSLSGKVYQLFAAPPKKVKSLPERIYGPKQKQRTRTPNTSEDGSKNYASILIDFAYLANPDKFDSRSSGNTQSPPGSAQKLDIHANAEQEQLEREFISIHQENLAQFHDLFTRIYEFYMDIQSFINELEQGFYCSYSVESLLQDDCDGRQLLCELFYLHGSILILTDIYIPVSIVFGGSFPHSILTQHILTGCIRGQFEKDSSLHITGTVVVVPQTQPPHILKLYVSCFNA